MSSINTKLFLFVLIISANSFAFDRSNLHKTSFDKTEVRYPSVLAILESLNRIAPFQKIVQQRSELDPCQSVNADAVNIMGAIDPAQIQPLETQPGALFFNYFEKCAKQIVTLGFSDPTNAKKNSDLILGPQLARAVGSPNWSSLRFSQLPVELQNQIVDRMIFFLVGPEEVLQHFNYVGPENVFRSKIANSSELRQFLRDNLLKANADESLLSFYFHLAALLRLGPILRN